MGSDNLVRPGSLQPADPITTYAIQNPYTYAVAAKGFLQQMRGVDPTIKLGVVVTPGEDNYGNTNHPVINPRTGQSHHGWTPVMLATLSSNNATPDFAIHHVYPEYTGQESDPFLLQTSVSWPSDAADLLASPEFE